MKQSLSLLIPSYNEEKHIEKAVSYYHSYLKKLKNLESFEIIICANGCTDNTPSLAGKISKKYTNVKYLVTKRKGLGIAIKLGLKKVSKDIVTYMPGDGEIDANFIGAALKIMDSRTMVIGSRKMAGKYEGKSFFRKILSYGLNVLTVILFSPRATEGIAVKMFNKEWSDRRLKNFKEPGFDSQMEMVYYALIDNLKIKKAPSAVFHRREASQSSVRIFNTVWVMFRVILKYGFKWRLFVLKQKLNKFI